MQSSAEYPDIKIGKIRQNRILWEEAKIHYLNVIQLPLHMPLSTPPELVPQASSYKITWGQGEREPGQVHRRL